MERLYRKIRKDWEDICTKYVNAFIKKHNIEDDSWYWVGDNPGTILCICDYFISMDDLRYDIDNNIQYILKVTDIREKENFTYIDVDILGYSEELIDSSITNYSNNLIIKTGTIIAQNIDGQLYLSSFTLENREDER